MPRIDLDVPFEEKDDAKKLGAKFDIKTKTWYIPDGIDPYLFRKWFPLRRILQIETYLESLVGIIEQTYRKQAEAIDTLTDRLTRLEQHVAEQNRNSLYDFMLKSDEDAKLLNRIQILESLFSINNPTG